MNTLKYQYLYSQLRPRNKYAIIKSIKDVKLNEVDEKFDFNVFRDTIINLANGKSPLQYEYGNYSQRVALSRFIYEMETLENERNDFIQKLADFRSNTNKS